MCSDLGLEMVPGFSTHWSMATETMVQLGYADNVHEWAGHYRTKRKHLPMPERVERIDGEVEASWKAALGARPRATDWQLFFEQRLAEEPWAEVVRTWWPRLAPGMSAGLTHGLIRTAHAIRSLERAPDAPSALQLKELAAGLAYWAAFHFTQPGPNALSGTRGFPDAVAAVPRLDPELRAGTIDRGRYKNEIPGWRDAISALARPTDLQQALSDMTLAFAQANLVHARGFPVPLLHTLTAPAALRMVLHVLPDEEHLPSYVAVWEAVAAVLANFAPPDPAEASIAQLEEGEEIPSEEELVARAIDNGDEHAIKFTEACLREHALRPDRRYLLAATRLIPRLPRYFR
jgi:hypothetical protein